MESSHVWLRTGAAPPIKRGSVGSRPCERDTQLFGRVNLIIIISRALQINHRRNKRLLRPPNEALPLLDLADVLHGHALLKLGVSCLSHHFLRQEVVLVCLVKGLLPPLDASQVLAHRLSQIILQLVVHLQSHIHVVQALLLLVNPAL